MYGLGSTHAHDTHHAYIGWGATPKRCMGFVCPRSYLCCSGNKQRQVHYPRTYFATCKEMASDSLSQSHLKRKKKRKKQGCSYKLTQQTTKGYSLCGVHPGLLPQISSGDLFFLSSSLPSSKAFAQGWPWPLSLSLSLPFSTLLACLIP